MGRSPKIEFFECFKYARRAYPLKIWVDGGSSLWLSSMLAVSWWERALFGDCRIEVLATFVRNKEEADIVIKFSHAVRTMEVERVFPEGEFYSRVAAILIKPQFSNSSYLPTILRHAMGHALLGLSHSGKKKSVMYPFLYAMKGKGLVLPRDYAAAVCYLSDRGVSVP